MTVSRVINKDGNVRPATRARVMAMISSLNYAPNSAARSLAGAAQTRIMLLYGNPSAAYLSEVLLGCVFEATQTDVQLLLDRNENREDAYASVQRAIDRAVDGVILPPPVSDDADIVAMLRDAAIPTVALASADPPAGVFAVSIDDEKAAFDMTRHLMALGHKRIGFIGGSVDQTASKRRLEGYRLALRDGGASSEPELIQQGDFSYRSGLDAGERLLALSRPPTAIFASNDDMAAAVVAVAHRRHLEVPEDLTVTGFDDTVLATSIVPELTTVRQPVEDMASAAVELLSVAARLRRGGKASVAERKLFAHELVLRRSDAAPGHSADGHKA